MSPWWAAQGLMATGAAGTIRWQDGAFVCADGPPEALQRFLMVMLEHGMGDGVSPEVGITPALADWQDAAEDAAREVFPNHVILTDNFDECWDEPGAVY